MAFDQNSMPMDLRPLNIARTVVEESRIAPVTTSGRNVEGFYANPSRDSVSPGSIPVYYPAMASDAGFVGLGHGNAAVQGQQVQGVAGWVQGNPLPAVVGVPGVTNPPGYCYSPSIGNRVGGNGSDRASDEGGDDSATGKKVKLMCSFGGKILPRPSDGALRYVGGQTRIISIRRDVSFTELVQKMANSYGQNVVIKYQLPEEDLDALVSVSCSDDLENMMDEYEKLIERSLDGSAKLRVFLFSASELDSSGVVQMGDFQDNGQRYVEAVNGIVDGAGGGIMRRESMASATSTQNSDLSGTEAIESTGHGQVDVIGPPSTGGLSPKNNYASSQETAPSLVSVDPKSAIYVEPSGAPVGFQMVRSHPPPTLSTQHVALVQMQQQQQVGFDLQQQQQMGFPPRAPYLQPYADPQQEALNRTDYVQYPSQMGFPTQLVGTVGPMFTQQQYRDNVVNVSPHQFIPAVHMTMAPSSHASIKPNAVQPIVQPQQIRLECYPEENTYGQRVVQLPGDQSYNAYHAQVSPAVLGGYSWHPTPQPEQVAFSEGLVPHQQVVLPEKLPRFEECYMCQKALPHAHSDTIAQGQKDSPTTTISDFNPVYHSLQLEDNIGGRPINRAAVTGPVGEGIAENQVAGAHPRVLDHMDYEAIKPQYGGVVVSQNVEQHYKNDTTVLRREGNHDLPQASLPQGGLAVGLQSPYTVVIGTVPQLYQENVVQKPVVPTQYQVKQDALMNKAVNVDSVSVGGMSSQTSDHLAHESPNVYSGIPVFVPKEGDLESSLAYDQLRQIDGRLENLGVRPSEIFLNSEQGMSPVDNSKKEDIMDNRAQQLAGREPYVDNAISKPKMVTDANRSKQKEMLPCTASEVPCALNFQPADSYEVTQQSLLVNPCYPHQRLAINHLAQDHILYGNPTAFSGIDSAQVTERIPPIGEWKDNSSRFQTNMACSDLETLYIDGNIPLSLSPVNRVGDMQDNSNSLFSSQDPWNLRHDTHFPPPRPNKILTRKEAYGTRDPFSDNRFGNSGESPTGNIGGFMTELRPDDGVYQPSGNSDTDCTFQSSKGSAEEHIKQELQAVAEGVAASVLQTSIPSNPDLSVHGRSGSTSEAIQDREVKNADVEVQHTDKSEDIKSKLPERANLGFPVSDGIGRLQIISNSDLEELRELGSGTFGTVYHGKWRGSDVAIKRINDRCFAGKPSEQERMRDDFWNEAIKLADLHHPNVVAFYGVVLDGPGGSVATVTEYMVNGSLRTALQKNEKNLDKRKRLLIAMDVAFGMEYLHGKNIVHFDLKSDNLLVNLRDPHRPICKVGDLGLSKVKCQTLISGGVRGTLPWMAPELLNGSSSLVSEKVDVFSFGIVLWELLTGDEPYADLHYGAIIGGIVSNTLRPPIPEYCDPEWRSLMERCWSADPSERPNFTEIASQLRTMAAKVPPKVQAQQQPPSTQPQAKN